MFPLLTINDNDNISFSISYSNDKLILLIQELLLKEQNIVSIYKNSNDSYSVYNKSDLDNNFIVDPLFSFFESDNLTNIYYSLKNFIKLIKFQHEQKLSFESKIEKIFHSNQQNYNLLNSKFNDLKQIIYSDSEESSKVYKYISSFIEQGDYDYADNYRFARVGDIYQEHIYETLKNEGCCGFIDFITEIDNIKYKIGFNYGH